MSHSSFVFYLLIVDIIFGSGNKFGLLIPLIALLIYLKNRNYNNWYFMFYAWIRLISPFLMIPYYIALFMIFTKIISPSQVGLDSTQFFQTPNFVFFSLLFWLWILWLLYTSFSFKSAIQHLRKDKFQDVSVDLSEKEGLLNEQINRDEQA